jgi:hypothetical protein
MLLPPMPTHARTKPIINGRPLLGSSSELALVVVAMTAARHRQPAPHRPSARAPHCTMRVYVYLARRLRSPYGQGTGSPAGSAVRRDVLGTFSTFCGFEGFKDDQIARCGQVLNIFCPLIRQRVLLRTINTSMCQAIINLAAI